MDVPPEKSLERYELLDRIAIGGMAEVFRAKAFGAHGFEKTLAIKRILPELAKDPEFEARFIAEAKLAVALSHANIVQVLDFGRFGGTLFIAMEHVSGLDLAALLKRYSDNGERVSIPAALHIAAQIARGLDFAHQHDVVHRDVSPSNILLSKAGEVKIADFGIAFAARPRRPRPKGKRRIMGKWRYMSPEQTQGGELSTASDLFSAASVMFELFTGRKLFIGDESDEIIDNILNMEIPKASELRPGLPLRLDEVLAQALERDPKNRPKRAAEMQRALTEMSYSSSIVATDLDVADTVARVLTESELEITSPGRRAIGIDDMIRKQLGGGGVRRTAIEDDKGAEAPSIDANGGTEVAAGDDDDSRPATMVRKGIDPHGLTLWEYESEPALDTQTIAAVPSAIRKQSGAFPVISDDKTGDRAKGGASTQWILVGALAIVLSLGAWAMFGRGRSGKSTAATANDAATLIVASSDAGAIDGSTRVVGTLKIDSVPQGAKIWVDGERISQLTPATIRLPEGEHRLAIEADGYRRFVDAKVGVTAGEPLRISPTLIIKKATLKVVTKPAGATVKLDGALLGTTPLERDDLKPRAKARLLIEKPLYHSIRLTIDLVDGKRQVLTPTLRSSIRYGTIKLKIVDSWAYVYLRGKKVGRATNPALRLPLGRHRLRLHNPITKREAFIDVHVVSGKANRYSAKL